MRLLPALLIGGCVLLSVGAVASMAEFLGIGVETWYGPLRALDWVYNDLSDKSFGAVSEAAQNRFNITVPEWASDLIVLYLAAALSFMSATTGVAKRENMVEWGKAAGLGLALPLAIPVFLWQAIRLRVVSRFARENTLSFFGYIVLVLGGYFGCVWANDAIYEPRAEQAQTAEASGQGTSGGSSSEQSTTVTARSEPARQAGTAKIDAGRTGTAAASRPLPVNTSLSADATPGDARALGETLGHALELHASGQAVTVQTMEDTSASSALQQPSMLPSEAEGPPESN